MAHLLGDATGGSPSNTVHPVGVPDVMGVAEIAERLGVGRSRADQITREKDFPDGRRLKMGTVWSTSDVEAWVKRRRPEPPEATEVKARPS